MNRYLQERKGRWYFRIRVPKMLQPHLNTEISYPIWGIDIKTANSRCIVLGERLKFIFEQAKSGVISMGILNPFVRGTCANILYRDSQGMFSQVTPPEEYEAAMRYYKTAIRERNANAAPEFISLVNNQGVEIDPDEPTDLPIIMNLDTQYRSVGSPFRKSYAKNLRSKQKWFFASAYGEYGLARAFARGLQCQ